MLRDRINVLILTLLFILAMMIYIDLDNRKDYNQLIDTINRYEEDAGIFLNILQQTVDSLELSKVRYDSMDILLKNCDSPTGAFYDKNN